MFRTNKQVFRVLNLFTMLALGLLAITLSSALAQAPEGAGRTEVSPAAWEVEIVAPSFTSGADFAATEVGNPWDMDSVDDIDRLWTTDEPSSHNGLPVSTTYKVENGILKISTNSTVAENDPNDPCEFPKGVPHRPLAFNMGGKRIDTYKYRYFSYRYKLIHAPQSLNRYKCGNVNRIRWYQNDLEWAEGRTSDILIPDEDHIRSAPNDWYTYKIDLWEYAHVAAPYRGPAQWNILQLMFHEANYGWPAQLDWAMLTAENVAGSSYTAAWNLGSAVRASATPTMTVYWSTDRTVGGVFGSGYVYVPPSGGGGTAGPNMVYLPVVLNHVVAGFSPLEADYSLQIDATGLTSGQYYYVAIEVDDGSSTAWFFSEVPVKKR